MASVQGFSSPCGAQSLANEITLGRSLRVGVEQRGVRDDPLARERDVLGVQLDTDEGAPVAEGHDPGRAASAERVEDGGGLRLASWSQVGCQPSARTVVGMNPRPEFSFQALPS